MRLLVAGDKVNFQEILLSCCRGEQLFNFELNVLICFILSSQNFVPSSFNLLIYLISFEISAFMFSDSYNESTRFTFLKSGFISWPDKFYAQQLWLISDLTASRSNNPIGLVCGAIKELLESQPLSLLVALVWVAPNFLALMMDLRVGTTRSDSLSDLSEIGWRLQLSFLLLISFSMIPSSLQLNLSRVSISCQCCELSSFCFSISSSIVSTVLLISSFYFKSTSIFNLIKYYKPTKLTVRAATI